MQLIGFPVSNQIEMVSCLGGNWKSAGGYLKTRMVVVIEPVGCTLTIGGRSGGQRVQLDVVDSVGVYSVVGHDKAFAASHNCDRESLTGGSQGETDRHADQARFRQC